MEKSDDGRRTSGWKRDPWDRFAGRYWDGENWTHHVVNADSTRTTDPVPHEPYLPEGPPAFVDNPTDEAGISETAQERRQGAAIAIAGAGAIALGCFLPWAKLTAPFVGSVTKSGMEGSDGIIFLALASAVALIGAKVYRSALESPARYRLGMAALSLALIGLTAFEALDLSDRFAAASRESDLIITSYGAGIWLVGLGSLATVVAWLRIPWADRPSSNTP